eukprot:Rmarinus@m.22533
MTSRGPMDAPDVNDSKEFTSRDKEGWVGKRNDFRHSGRDYYTRKPQNQNYRGANRYHHQYNNNHRHHSDFSRRYSRSRSRSRSISRSPSRTYPRSRSRSRSPRARRSSRSRSPSPYRQHGYKGHYEKADFDRRPYRDYKRRDHGFRSFRNENYGHQQNNREYNSYGYQQRFGHSHHRRKYHYDERRRHMSSRSRSRSPSYPKSRARSQMRSRSRSPSRSRSISNHDGPQHTKENELLEMHPSSKNNGPGSALSGDSDAMRESSEEASPPPLPPKPAPPKPAPPKPAPPPSAPPPSAPPPSAPPPSAPPPSAPSPPPIPSNIQPQHPPPPLPSHLPIPPSIPPPQFPLGIPPFCHPPPFPRPPMPWNSSIVRSPSFDPPPPGVTCSPSHEPPPPGTLPPPQPVPLPMPPNPPLFLTHPPPTTNKPTIPASPTSISPGPKGSLLPTTPQRERAAYSVQSMTPSPHLLNQTTTPSPRSILGSPAPRTTPGPLLEFTPSLRTYSGGAPAMTSSILGQNHLLTHSISGSTMSPCLNTGVSVLGRVKWMRDGTRPPALQQTVTKRPQAQPTVFKGCDERGEYEFYIPSHGKDFRRTDWNPVAHQTGRRRPNGGRPVRYRPDVIAQVEKMKAEKDDPQLRGAGALFRVDGSCPPLRGGRIEACGPSDPREWDPCRMDPNNPSEAGQFELVNFIPNEFDSTFDTVLVHNLPVGVEEMDLETLFAGESYVGCTILTVGGERTGSATVHLVDEGGAREAVAKRNNYVFGGYKLLVELDCCRMKEEKHLEDFRNRTMASPPSPLSSTHSSERLRNEIPLHEKNDQVAEWLQFPDTRGGAPEPAPGVTVGGGAGQSHDTPTTKPPGAGDSGGAHVSTPTPSGPLRPALRLPAALLPTVPLKALQNHFAAHKPLKTFLEPTGFYYVAFMDEKDRDEAYNVLNGTRLHGYSLSLRTTEVRVEAPPDKGATKGEAKEDEGKGDTKVDEDSVPLTERDVAAVKVLLLERAEKELEDAIWGHLRRQYINTVAREKADEYFAKSQRNWEFTPAPNLGAVDEIMLSGSVGSDVPDEDESQDDLPADDDDDDEPVHVRKPSVSASKDVKSLKKSRRRTLDSDSESDGESAASVMEDASGKPSSAKDADNGGDDSCDDDMVDFVRQSRDKRPISVSGEQDRQPSPSVGIAKVDDEDVLVRDIVPKRKVPEKKKPNKPAPLHMPDDEHPSYPPKTAPAKLGDSKPLQSSPTPSAAVPPAPRTSKPSKPKPPIDDEDQRFLEYVRNLMKGKSASASTPGSKSLAAMSPVSSLRTPKLVSRTPKAASPRAKAVSAESTCARCVPIKTLVSKMKTFDPEVIRALTKGRRRAAPDASPPNGGDSPHVPSLPPSAPAAGKGNKRAASKPALTTTPATPGQGVANGVNGVGGVGAALSSLPSTRSTRLAQRHLLGQDDLDLQVNMLHTRNRRVKFAKSQIHNWGLFALEDISVDEMVIEYVGELVRKDIADIREVSYEKQGIGSSYMFRLDKDYVVDATRKGSLARFINHSCKPNCRASIIRVGGTKRIAIYAQENIRAGEEICYDYKFPLEDMASRIPCLCQAPTCKGYLNWLEES